MKCISFFWEEVHCKHLRITNRPAPLSVRGPQLWQTVPLYTQTKFWPWTPGGPRQRDRRIEWPSVIKCLWLCENFFPHSSYCLNKQLLKISFCVFCFCFKNSPTIAHICSWRLICQAHSNFPVKYFFFFFTWSTIDFSVSVGSFPAKASIAWASKNDDPSGVQ